MKVVRKGSRASEAGPGDPHAGPERSSPACVAEWTYEKGAGEPRARSPRGWTSRSGPAASCALGSRPLGGGGSLYVKEASARWIYS